MASKETRLQVIQEQVEEHRLLYGSVEELNDGYHTFKELYEHRITLYIALCKALDYSDAKNQCARYNYNIWKSTTHSDGVVWDGWFILGIGLEKGDQITYHLPNSKWEECDFAAELDKAPEWDGHTSADVLERLKKL